MLDINHLLDEKLVKIFSHFVGCLFTLVIIYFDAIPFVNYCFYFLSYWSCIQKVIACAYKKTIFRRWKGKGKGEHKRGIRVIEGGEYD
jgi:hypothetical protein